MHTAANNLILCGQGKRLKSEKIGLLRGIIALKETPLKSIFFSQKGRFF
jgi:hypothetical protein